MNILSDILNHYRQLRQEFERATTQLDSGTYAMVEQLSQEFRQTVRRLAMQYQVADIADKLNILYHMADIAMLLNDSGIRSQVDRALQQLTTEPLTPAQRLTIACLQDAPASQIRTLMKQVSSAPATRESALALEFARAII